VVTGCGSVALAEHLAKATCLPGDEIVYAWRSFEAYPILTAVTGATSVRVPNTGGHGHDLGAMADAITDRTPAGVRLQSEQPRPVRRCAGTLSTGSSRPYRPTC
jgi:histidinol-phosphate aminotransferase